MRSGGVVNACVLLLLWAAACGRLRFEGTDNDAARDGSAGTGGMDAASDDAAVDAMVDDGALGDASADARAMDAADDATVIDATAGDASADTGVIDAASDATLDGGVDAGTPLTCRVGCLCEYDFGSRYMLCNESLDWPTARAACEAEGMQLLRVESAVESTWLRFRTLQGGFPKFHLGANDLMTEGTWQWTDGTTFWQGTASGAPVNSAFSVWASGEPNSFVIGENCSEIQSLRGWNDCVCDLGKPVVCKAARDSAPSCGNGIVESGEACDDARTGDYCTRGCDAWVCPDDCTCFDADGQGFAVCSPSLSFRDAAVECGAHGMTLARVHSMAADQAIRTRADQASIGTLWIGAFDIDQDNAWVWTDLSPLWMGTAMGAAQAYAHFAIGAPSGMPNRDCALMNVGGEWRDEDCNMPHAYACQRIP